MDQRGSNAANGMGVAAHLVGLAAAVAGHAAIIAHVRRNVRSFRQGAKAPVQTK